MAKKRKLTIQQQKAVQLMASKDVHGMTNVQIAKEVGVTEQTVQRWKHIPEFADKMIEISEELQRAFLADTYAQLRNIVNSRTVQDKDKLKAIEIMLKNQGRLKDVQETTVRTETKSVEDMLADLDISDGDEQDDAEDEEE